MIKETYKQNLSDFITNDLEKAFAITILMMNTIMILWQASNFHKLIRFYIKIMDPTLLKINTLLFILCLIRIQAYSYAVFGCFLKESGQQLFQPSVFRTLQSSSFIFYDLVLGVIGAKWISIMQKFFNYFKGISYIEMIINLFFFIFWCACQIFLFIAEYYHNKTWDQRMDKIYSILYFIQSFVTLMTFVIGCILFRKHVKNINTINEKYKKYLDYSIGFLIVGQALRLLFSLLRIWYSSFLIQFKYGFNDKNTQDTTVWQIHSFLLTQFNISQLQKMKKVQIKPYIVVCIVQREKMKFTYKQKITYILNTINQILQLIFIIVTFVKTNFLISIQIPAFINQRFLSSTIFMINERSIISFLLYLLSDYIPTSILLLIFYPNQHRIKKSLIVESAVEIE